MIYDKTIEHKPTKRKLKNYDDWKAICAEFCKQNGYKLIFVKQSDFGYMTEDGQCVHLYIDELKDILLKKGVD